MQLFLIWIFIFCTPLFSAPFEVLTLGGTLMDHILFVNDDYLSKIPGTKGRSQLVEYAHVVEILEKSGQEAILRPGGNSVNVIKGLSHLGHSCAVIGKIG